MLKYVGYDKIFTFLGLFPGQFTKGQDYTFANKNNKRTFYVVYRLLPYFIDMNSIILIVEKYKTIQFLLYLLLIFVSSLPFNNCPSYCLRIHWSSFLTEFNKKYNFPLRSADQMSFTPEERHGRYVNRSSVWQKSQVLKNMVLGENNLEILCWGQVSSIFPQFNRERVLFYLKEEEIERSSEGFTLYLPGEVLFNTSVDIHCELGIKCLLWNAGFFVQP